MVLTSLAEVLSLGVVFPFLGMLLAPEQVADFWAIRTLADYFHITSAKDLQIPLTIMFSLAALFSGGMRLLLMRTQLNFSVIVGVDVSSGIYNRTLHQPYETHSRANSSVVINSITTKVNTIVSNVVIPVLTIISGLVMLSFVFIALLLIDPIISLFSIIGLATIYTFITLMTRKIIARNSINIARESTKVVKFLQEGIGGIRDILIDGNQRLYYRLYRESDLPLKKAQGQNQFIAGSPRYAIESLSMVFIAIFAYFLINQSTENINVLPVLGTFALAAQRMLPVLQQAYSAYTNLNGSKQSFRDVMDLLDQPLPSPPTRDQGMVLPFNKDIILNQVHFSYKYNNAIILKNINLRIEKGSKVGVVGSTGSGKSTLLDIMMGLLAPTKGQILVDNILISDLNEQSWQKNIAHVPQTIFLTDDTIIANIAFGVSAANVDFERVKKVAKEARLEEVIDTWPDKYLTLVGERGSRLSGGQRQRIGIARALYKDASVIILDEATSALDSETERGIMASINRLNKSITVLIISHRPTTLKFCDQIIEISGRKIHKIYESYIDYDNETNP